MQEGISTRTRIAILIYSMTNAVLFGIGIILVLNVPSFAAHAWIGIPVVVVLSLVLAVPVAWRIAPRLRARWGRRRAAADRLPTQRSGRNDPRRAERKWRYLEHSRSADQEQATARRAIGTTGARDTRDRT